MWTTLNERYRDPHQRTTTVRLEGQFPPELPYPLADARDPYARAGAGRMKMTQQFCRDSMSVILYFKHYVLRVLPNQDVGRRCARVAMHIRQCFLKHAE